MTRESITRTNTFLPYEVIMATTGHLCLCLPCCFAHVTVAAVLLKEGAAKKVSLWEAKPLWHVRGSQESCLRQWVIFLLVIEMPAWASRTYDTQMFSFIGEELIRCSINILRRYLAFIPATALPQTVCLSLCVSPTSCPAPQGPLRLP